MVKKTPVTDKQRRPCRPWQECTEQQCSLYMDDDCPVQKSASAAYTPWAQEHRAVQWLTPMRND
jgi:hypothetical protein